ncbi:MAG TPA: hypothetical protein VE863_03360 [Pyrinomonadaceae bacterium]|nr:hypothetical protein [Pyrinomonadaceae bacterium]
MATTFPKIDFTVGLADVERQASLDRIAQSTASVCERANEAHSLRLMANEIAAYITALLKRDAKLLHSSAQRIAAFVLMWMAPIAACCIDYVLLGSVLEYFALRVYSDPAMVTVTRAIIPPAIVTIEMFIAAQRANAQEQATEAGRSHAHWIWHVFPLLMIIPLPTLVVATNIAAAPTARTGAIQTILTLEIVGLVALSVVMHGVILYGGQLAADARGYLFSKLRLRRANRKLNRLRKRFYSTIKGFRNAYARHLRSVDDHNQQFTTHLSPGPFDRVTQELLTEMFGDDPDQTQVEFPSRTESDVGQTSVF